MIGTAIRTRREQLGLSISRAAALAGYHQKSWQGWESGEEPKPETLVKIARVLRCSASEFTNGKAPEAEEYPVGSVAWEREQSLKRQAEQQGR